MRRGDGKTGVKREEKLKGWEEQKIEERRDRTREVIRGALGRERGGNEK